MRRISRGLDNCGSRVRKGQSRIRPVEDQPCRRYLRPGLTCGCSFRSTCISARRRGDAAAAGRRAEGGAARDDREGGPPVDRGAGRPGGAGGLLRGRARRVRAVAAVDRHGGGCDVVAPSLIPVRAGDRVKTDRRDAEKLGEPVPRGAVAVRAPPTPETEGLRDLLRCRDDIRCARTAARHRVGSSCCATGTCSGRARRPGRPSTRRGSAANGSQTRSRRRRWCKCSSTRRAGPPARRARHQARADRRETSGGAGRSQSSARSAASHADRARADRRDRRLPPLRPSTRARLLAGDHPSEYSSGEQQHRGHITHAGNHHARRLLIEAAWHYRHAPRRPGAGRSHPTGGGRRRSACFTATATSAPRGSARPS